MANKNSVRKRSLVKKCISCNGKGYIFAAGSKENCNKCYGRGMK